MTKVSLYTPSYPPDIGGNATSTFRLVRGLRAKGLDVTVHRASDPVPGDPGVWEGRIVHVFHAFRTGGPLLPTLRLSDAPLVVSMAGTDLSHDLLVPEHAQTVREVCTLADALVLMHSRQEALVLESMPEVEGKLVTIHPGVHLPAITDGARAAARKLRSAWGVAEDELLFLLPAGLRAVKRPLLAIEPLERLREEGFPVVLGLVGTVLDDEVAAAFDRATTNRAWVRRFPPLSPEEMTACYLAADVVLNTSESEGLSNAVIEAMAAARPVLASDIVGNRACISHGHNGFFFKDPTEFIGHARRLAKEPALRRVLGTRARADVAERFDPDREVERHIQLYQSLRSKRPNNKSSKGRTRKGVIHMEKEIRLTELASCGG